MNHTYVSLFVVTLVAFVSPWIATRVVRGLFPTIVIEILLGIVIGPNGLHLASSTVYVQFLATFGFSYLLFLSGLELDFNLLTDTDADAPQRFPPWIASLGFFGFVLLWSAVVATGLSHFGIIQHPFMVTLLLTTVALGIVMPTLKETGWIASPFGQELLRYAVLADVVTLLLLSAYVTAHSTGHVASVLLVLVLLVVVLLISRVVRWSGGITRFLGARTGTHEIGIRGAFALILLFLALSVALGTAVVVGAFLAGATLSLVSNRATATVNDKLQAIGYGFLLPVFFVNVGLTFHLPSLLSSLAHNPDFAITLGVLFVGHYLGKLIPSWIWFRRFPRSQRLAGGFLLGSQLSLIVAAVQLGQQIGVLTPTLANGYLLLAIITCLISPALFTRLLRHTPPPQTEPWVADSVVLDSRNLPQGWVAEQVEVRSRRVAGQSLQHLRLPADVLFISIVRQDEALVPRGGTVLKQFDRIQVLGHPESIRRIRRRIE